MRWRIACAATTALILVSAASTGQPPPPKAGVHWPGWRGPTRDGWVDGFRPPTPWPDRLERLWQVEVGTGYASPVVSGDRVYLHARQGDDEVVWSLDLATGSVHWRRSYAVPFTPGPGAQKHGRGPKSTPALAEGRLFTMSITGRLSAWDAASGDPLWHEDYGSRFKRTRLIWGAAFSPLIVVGDDVHPDRVHPDRVHPDRVVAHFGTETDGSLIALDARSGQEVWSSGTDGPSYASAILVELDGSRQIVTLTEKALIGVESTTGRLLWEYAYPQDLSNQNMVTPVHHRGVILLGGEQRGIRALAPRREGDRWIVEELWHQEEVALDMSSAVINGELLFGFSHFGKGRLFCLEPDNGKVLWQGPPRTGENVALLAIPGQIVALRDDGELWIVEASGEAFERIASYRVADSPTWAHPVLVENGILIKDHETLALWSLGD